MDLAVKTSGLIAVCWCSAAATPAAAQSQNGGKPDLSALDAGPRQAGSSRSCRSPPSGAANTRRSGRRMRSKVHGALLRPDHHRSAAGRDSAKTPTGSLCCTRTTHEVRRISWKAVATPRSRPDDDGPFDRPVGRRYSGDRHRRLRRAGFGRKAVPYTGKALRHQKLTLDQGGDKIHVALTLDDPSITRSVEVTRVVQAHAGRRDSRGSLAFVSEYLTLRRPMQRSVRALLVLVSLCATGALQAHHSFPAVYDAKARKTISGVVTQDAVPESARAACICG